MMLESGVDKDFEFDCPRNFIDLQSKCHQNSISVENEIWFQMYHPEHDEEIEQKTTNQVSSKNDANSHKALRSKRSTDVVKKSAATSKYELENEIRKFNKKRVNSEQQPSQHIPRNTKSMKADNKENTGVAVTGVSAEEELERINNGVNETLTNAPIRSFHIPQVGSASDASLISSQALMQAKLKDFKLSKGVKQKGSVSCKSTNSTDTHSIKKPKSDQRSEEELLSLLKKHNDQFSKSTTYEPPRHSVRDVRAWEKVTGKVWATLSMEDRELANAEIMALKHKK